ncbi:unnamed protein product, partial [Discosporangium mesarthrocarpum]
TELLVEGIPVVETDVTATNGVLHRMGGVMPLPPNAAGVLANPPFPLSAAGGFTAVRELLDLAGALVNSTLGTAGPFTVLAPTDE